MNLGRFVLTIDPGIFVVPLGRSRLDLHRFASKIPTREEGVVGLCFRSASPNSFALLFLLLSSASLRNFSEAAILSFLNLSASSAAPLPPLACR